MATFSHKKQQTKVITSAGLAEQRTFDGSLSRGNSAVQLFRDKVRARNAVLRSQEAKDQLHDFVFGKTTENPLKEVNEEFEKKAKLLRTKKYVEVNIVSGRNFRDGYNITNEVNKANQE